MQSTSDPPASPGSAPAGFRYRAFISYSHADSAWAKWIHHALETYPIPARLVGQATMHGPVPARLKPVFRDRDELPTAAELGPVLERALRDSGALVVLCSPSSAKSRWVNEEVLFFKKLGRGDRVFPLIVRGAPGGRDGQECFPPGVRAVVNAEGTVTPDALEPLAADAQPDKDGKSLALLKVIAGITGLPLDELRQREAQRRQKRLAVLAGVGLVLTAVMTTLAGMAFHQRRAAMQNEAWAKINEHKAVAAARRAEAGEQLAKAAEAAALREKENVRRALARAAVNLAEAAMREGNGPETRAALNEVPADLRDSTWRYLYDQADTSIARARATSASIEAAAPHPRRAHLFAIANRERVVTVVEVGTRSFLIQMRPGFKNPDPVLRVAFSPDGERLAVGQWGAGGIVIHRVRDGGKLLEWEAFATERLEFSPDGKLLLQTERSRSYTQGFLKVWDAETGKLRWEYESTAAGVKGAFTPDGRQVLTHGGTDKLRLVNAADGSLVRTLGKDVLTALAVRPDGRMAVAAVRNGGIQGISLPDGEVLYQFRPHDRTVQHLLFTPDGARFVSVAVLADGRQALQLWESDTGAPTQTLLGGSGPVTDAAVHPVSGELFVCGPDTRVWELTGTPEKWTLRGQAATLAFWGSDDTVFAPMRANRSTLLGLGGDRPATLWEPPKTTYSDPSVSADGRFAVLGQVGAGRTPILLLRNPGPNVEQVAAFTTKYSLKKARLNPNGSRLALSTGASGHLELHDTAGGGTPLEMQRGNIRKVNDFAWLDGQRLAGLVTVRAERGSIGAAEGVVLWDAATGNVTRTATNRTAMDVLAPAPDGRRFAEAGTDKLVRIRDAATLAVVREFRAHDGPLTALAWHPTKPILATAATDLSIRLWNLDTGKRLEELRGPLAPPHTLAFSPGGHRLGCAAADNVTRIWEPSSLADRIVPRQDGDGWEDLLAPLTPAMVAKIGREWRLDGGELFSPEKRFSLLPLPGDFAGASYHLRVRLRQIDARESLNLLFPVADRMLAFTLDGWPQDGFYSGLNRVGGKDSKGQPGSPHGRQVTDSQPHALEVVVQLDGASAKISVTLDDRPLHEWAGPASALDTHPGWIFTPGVIALGAHTTGWAVREVKVRRL